ncbi:MULTISPECIES: NAD-dependent epimerase/dehydratase family protein [unclassified Halobacteriovorax]|uniref:NAD-dependent epimerase/dehydratase family protein n=1 Tax=unclassified Halobacteriovorax TaxID=2639665 RepID=UPI000EB6AF84|nr:NAD-dependent epimerase/dehydratase family protein [Halobacteriovorax sp. BALOs_7]AYF44867.1 3-beta hydroxysteroid dehydrogenase/isomerase family protein [Halobacteriovorax sp. BALOs_7]
MLELPMDHKGKNFLIAGAAGFVPSTVAQLYLDKGATVYGLDNFITGSKSNIELLSKYENFHFTECDITHGLPDFGDIKFDYILSLASPASPIDFKVIPLEIMTVNSIGTQNLLELAKDHGARFLEASTSEVYGDPEIHPQTEDYVGHVNPIGPRSCYDEAKRYAEALTMTYRRKYNVDTKIIRIFNTYGPRMRPDDGRVIPNFINQALEGRDITVYGDGSQTRSFCYVTDLANAIDHVLMLGDHMPYNIGNPDEYSIKETGELIVDALDSSSKLTYQELPKDDPKRRRPDINRVMKLGYLPKVTFAEGIERTAKFFREYKK